MKRPILTNCLIQVVDEITGKVIKFAKDAKNVSAFEIGQYSRNGFKTRLQDGIFYAWRD